jgi:DNA-binding transcriptional regulator GbsR (MarR family)
VTETEIRTRHFIDQMGVLFVRSGGSVSMGRILGHLLVCDPPEQSLAQLGQALGISKGGTSQLTRHLEQMGLILRVPAPDNGRGTWYRVRSGAWAEILREQIALTRLFVELADQGLVLLRDEPKARRERLLDLREFNVTMAEELEEFADKYERRVTKKTRRT